MAVLYFFAEPKNIFDCLRPMQHLQFAICCNSFCSSRGRYITNTWTALYTLGVALLTVAGLGYAVYASVNSDENRLSKLDNLLLSIGGLELVMSSCVFLITATSMQWQARRHVALIERIHRLDERLEQEFGANLNYRKLMRKSIIVMTIVTTAYCGAVNSAIAQTFDAHWLVTLMGAACYALITVGPHFNGFVHISMTEVLRIRFRLLQRIIERDFLIWRFPDMTLRERRVYGAIELVKEFHLLIHEVNGIYMWSLISALAHDFTLTTSELYLIFGTQSFTPTQLFYVVLCMLPPLCKLIMTPIYCHTAIAEGQKCFQKIEQVDGWFPQSALIRKMVSAMMYWQIENKIEFQIGLAIVLNKPIIATVTSIIFNYLLILIQFRMTQDMSEEIEKQKNTLQEWVVVEF